MKNQLSKEMQDLLVQTMAASGIPELEKAKQVIEASGYSDEETAPVLEEIDAKIEEIKAADTKSDEVLDSKEVKDHVQSEVDKATAKSETKVIEATEAKDQAEATLKTNTIDSIISYSIVLKKESIDIEDVESSITKLRDELSSKSVDELKDSLTPLAEEIKKTFSNSPSTKLEDETIKEDGQINPEDSKEGDDDTKDEPKPIKGLPDLLARIASLGKKPESK